VHCNEIILIFISFVFQFLAMKYLVRILLLLPLTFLGQTSFEKGENYFKLEKWELAKVQLEKSLKQNPSDLKSIEYLGDIQCHSMNWQQAIPYYEKLMKVKPSEAEYFYKFGGATAMLAKESNKFSALSLIHDAIDSFEKTIALDRNHIGARWALLEIYIQLPGIVGGSERKAKKYAEELLRISPVDGYLAKGHVEEYFRRYSAAEKNYKKAIEIGNSLTTYQKLANLYKNKMDQPEKAKQLLAAYNEKNKS